jgi:hypothetical protein
MFWSAFVMSYCLEVKDMNENEEKKILDEIENAPFVILREIEEAEDIIAEANSNYIKEAFDWK